MAATRLSIRIDLASGDRTGPREDRASGGNPLDRFDLGGFGSRQAIA
jgi:hypothetical protein